MRAWLVVERWSNLFLPDKLYFFLFVDLFIFHPLGFPNSPPPDVIAPEQLRGGMEEVFRSSWFADFSPPLEALSDGAYEVTPSRGGGSEADQAH